MDADRKAGYQERAAAEREKVAAQLEAYRRARGNDLELEAPDTAEDGGGGGPKDPLELVFPANRIRKICKLDPDVKNVSKEALQLVVKAAELFTTNLGAEAVKVARFSNRRKLLPEDVAHVCTHRDKYTFLKDDMKDLVKWQREAARKDKKKKAADAAALAAATSSAASAAGSTGEDQTIVGGESSNHKSKKDAKQEAAIAGSKPLTSYFSAK